MDVHISSSSKVETHKGIQVLEKYCKNYNDAKTIVICKN